MRSHWVSYGQASGAHETFPDLTDVRHRYPLGAAADTHRDLEARRTSGQIVLLP